MANQQVPFRAAAVVVVVVAVERPLPAGLELQVQDSLLRLLPDGAWNLCIPRYDGESYSKVLRDRAMRSKI